MKKILLINQDTIPHYRVEVYEYMRKFLNEKGYNLSVISGGIQKGTEEESEFSYKKTELSFGNLKKYIADFNPKIIIFWVNLKYLYLFPTIIFAKMHGIKTIYWGHGRDLLDKNSLPKNIAYYIEQWLCDALVLYAEHLKIYVSKRFYKKLFVANNTLNAKQFHINTAEKERILLEFGIQTKKNIICIGRLQKRKRIGNLVKAFKALGNKDVGLILAGPDTDQILDLYDGSNIYKIGPIYGRKKFELLSASDIFCIPGAVGLSIVDAFYCGLPIVTEDGDESPEIMYLKNGINGFIVNRGDISELSLKLKTLIENDRLREKFSQEAMAEIARNGNMEVMCNGFLKAISYTLNQKKEP